MRAACECTRSAARDSRVFHSCAPPPSISPPPLPPSPPSPQVSLRELHEGRRHSLSCLRRRRRFHRRRCCRFYAHTRRRPTAAAAAGSVIFARTSEKRDTHAYTRARARRCSHCDSQFVNNRKQSAAHTCGRRILAAMDPFNLLAWSARASAVAAAAAASGQPTALPLAAASTPAALALPSALFSSSSAKDGVSTALHHPHHQLHAPQPQHQPPTTSAEFIDPFDPCHLHAGVASSAIVDLMQRLQASKPPQLAYKTLRRDFRRITKRQRSRPARIFLKRAATPSLSMRPTSAQKLPSLPPPTRCRPPLNRPF